MLAGCVTGNAGGQIVQVDGVAYAVRQEADAPSYGYVVDQTGNGSAQVVGRAKTVIVDGAPDQGTAIRAMGAFCGIDVDPAAWDTDFVYRDSDGSYWFAQTCP